MLEEGGVRVLQREFAVHEVGRVELGIVGGKGFVGGFPGAELPDFGEPLLREVYGETTREVEALEAGLEAISGCHRRLVLLHYAPIPRRSSASRRRSGRSSARHGSLRPSARTARTSSCTARAPGHVRGRARPGAGSERRRRTCSARTSCVRVRGQPPSRVDMTGATARM